MWNRSNDLWNIEKIVVHCAATPSSMDIGVEEIRNWHVDRGWDDIGYHYVIRRNGDIEPGRQLAFVGAHAKGHNKTSIGICMVGGVDDDGDPADNFNLSQFMALDALIKSLMIAFPSIVEAVGHRDLPGVHKACPSFDLGFKLLAVRKYDTD